MPSWWFVARIKEFYKYKGADKEIKYKYEPSLINSNFKERVDEITELYFKIYQKNSNGECDLNNHVERLIMGLIKKNNIEAEINTNDEQNIREVIRILNNLKILHNKYFVKNNNIELNFNTLPNIRDSLSKIYKIKSHDIDLKKQEQNFKNTLPDNLYSISEVTRLLIELLEQLNKDIDKHVEEYDQYYKKNPIRNWLKCPKFRKWNYNKYIENDIRSFINRVEIKFSDIEKEKTILDLVIDKNLISSLTLNGPNKQHLQNQAIINLKKMYTNYRKKN